MSAAFLSSCLLSLSVVFAAAEPTPTELNSVRLYVPIPLLPERFGDDAEPIGDYIKSLQQRTDEILSKEKPPEAKGLLVAVGIKSKRNTRIWCEAVDGEIPEELLRRLE